MAGRRLAVLAAIGLVVAGCGGSSAAQKRADRADYVRAAAAACEQAGDELARHDRRRKARELVAFVDDARASIKTQTDRLHELHDDLGDASSPKIDGFDRALGPYQGALQPIADASTVAERDRAAARLRRQGGRLFRAAQAAGLERCGRGGNLIAERQRLFDYREDYLALERQSSEQIVAVDESGRGAALFRAFDRVTRLFDDFRRKLGGLTPPRELRSLHQRVRRSILAVVQTRRRLTPDIYRERGVEVFAELDRRFPRYQRLERQLRRELNR